MSSRVAACPLRSLVSVQPISRGVPTFQYMVFDGQHARIRGWLRHIEFDLSVLLLAALVVDGIAISATLSQLAFFFGFFVPIFLAVTVLLRSGLDMYLISQTRGQTVTNLSRWHFLLQFTIFWILSLLAVATLSIVFLTFAGPTMVDTEGGVVFGPVLWMLVGTILALVILLRFAVEHFLIEDSNVFPVSPVE